jgi:hypothetical protein
LKKALTIGLVAAALAGTLPFVFAGSKSKMVPSVDATPGYNIVASVRMADASAVVPVYTRGPRIIHVPQAFERNERLNSRASVTQDPAYSDDDLAPPPRRQIAPPVRATPRWTPHREVAPPPPRRAEPPAKPRSETRTVRHIDMSKPKAEAKAEPPVPQPPSPRRAVLSAPPRVPEITADTPPPGYNPPAAAPQDDGYGNKY